MIYELGERRPRFAGDYYVAPNAAVIGSVVFGVNASVWFNVSIRGDNDDFYYQVRDTVKGIQGVHGNYVIDNAAGYQRNQRKGGKRSAHVATLELAAVVHAVRQERQRGQ